MTKDVAATEDDARAYYDANKDKFAEPDHLERPSNRRRG